MKNKEAIEAMSKYPETNVYRNYYNYRMYYNLENKMWWCFYEDWEDSQTEFRWFEGNCSHKVDSCVMRTKGRLYEKQEIEDIAKSLTN